MWGPREDDPDEGHTEKNRGGQRTGVPFVEEPEVLTRGRTEGDMSGRNRTHLLRWGRTLGGCPWGCLWFEFGPCERVYTH